MSIGFNLELTEEQELLRNTIREIATEQFKPKATYFDHSGEFPWENIKIIAENDLFGIPFDEKYGGVGEGYLSYAIATEEISRACASTGTIYSAHVSLACSPIYQFGTEEQKQKYLVPMIRGTVLGAFALTEPNAGSDPSNIQTISELKGDHYILNGTKIFITNAGEAQFYIVFATTDKSKRHKGISAFIVDKNFEGFKVGKKEDKLGIRASSTREIIFEDCKVPKENLLGQEGEGFRIAMWTLDGGRIGIAGQAVGIAQACLDLSIEYSKNRVQFGKPISELQAIQFMIADMATNVEAARLLTWQAAYLKDSGVKRFSKEAAMAKLFASETAMQSSIKCVQILGGYGYTKDFPAERFLRDAKITEIYEGTSEIQRLVIASQLLK